MQLNNLIFPAPVASYSTKFNPDLLWIPKPNQSPLLPPAKISKTTIFSSSVHFKKMNFSIPFDKSSSSPLQSPELSNTDPFKNYEISIPNPFKTLETTTTPSFRKDNPFWIRKVKDFGLHNNLFSINQVAPFSTKSETRKGMSFFTNGPKIQKEKNQNAIPCLYYEYPGGSNLVIMHFHANAEDIGHSFQYMKIVGSLLKVNSFLFI
jgi:hypothetical protein